MRFSVWMLAGALPFVGSTAVPAEDQGAPRYTHIIVIIEENHTADQIIGSAAAPNLNRLAKDYGYASNFYAERHPSEPNYVAIIGGDTFGIADDDAFWCKPKSTDAACPHAKESDYVDHAVAARNLTDQLAARGLSWKGYFESIPEPGARVSRWPTESSSAPAKPAALYASKHNGFMNFQSVQSDPSIARRIAGFDALDRDIAGNTLPAYAQIVPDQCDDMHGLRGASVPPDCTSGEALVRRGDAIAGALVDKIMHSAAWSAPGNFAIVITFDENDTDSPNSHPNWCCGSGPLDPHNPGGGWIPTIVVTNHGPRHATDATPYNHYSLLRTTEAAFGIADYLGHAADAAKGVRTMTPLFAVAK